MLRGSLSQSTRRALVGSLAAVALVTALPVSTASAATPTGGTASLAGVKARSAVAIAARHAALTARMKLVDSSTANLTATDRQALQTLITADESGLAALGQKIAADTDLATARIDHGQIFTGYRVYALALPQVRLVRASDRFQSVVLTNLTDARTRLTDALAKAGKTSQAATRTADLSVQIQAIQTATDGLSARLIALTPSQWNADHAVLTPSRKSLSGARTALRAARADIAAVLVALR